MPQPPKLNQLLQLRAKAEAQAIRRKALPKLARSTQEVMSKFETRISLSICNPFGITITSKCEEI